MSDFAIRKQNENTTNTKTFTVNKSTIKQIVVISKLLTFVGVFSGLIYMSMASNNLMLSEILTTGGLLSLVFFIHTLSNRQ